MQQEIRHERVIGMKSDSAVTVELTLAPRRQRRTRSETPPPQPMPRPASNRLPRITRLMALAIKFQEMISRGEVQDYADLARLGHVSRARITQIMNLLNLAPDIQEQLLDLAMPNRAFVCERHTRRITNLVYWSHQRKRWQEQIAS